MDRLKQLIQDHTYGKITMSELMELADLLIAANKLLKANGPHINKKVN